MLSIIINVATVIMGIIGFRIAYGFRGWKIFIFYTEISNAVGLLSSLLYLLGYVHAATWRYLACVMLTMTFLISLFILSPSEGSVKKVMLQAHCLYFHTLIPLLTLFSYIFLEPHSNAWYLPVTITLIYGCIMYYMNCIDKVTGPYPFFEVHRLGFAKSLMWFLCLLGVIILLSLLIMAIA